jgi:RND family efflux transporter MFP subunit
VEGDKVKRGQVLLELDDRLARVELKQARAQEQQVTLQKEQAEREATRFRELQAQAVTSELESEREQSEALELNAASDGARATVQARTERVHRHRIDAPFEGTVARRLVDPGDWLSPGIVALQLVTDNRVEILVRVPVELLEGLSGVKSILLRRGKSEVAAKLSGTVNSLERSTRTALLRLDPDERPSWLRSGANVDVVFRLEKSGRVVVPRDALVHGVAGVRVIRVKNEQADPVPVDVLETSGDQALVDGNELRVGDRVVVRGNERLRPRQPLAPKPQSSSKP